MSNEETTGKLLDIGKGIDLPEYDNGSFIGTGLYEGSAARALQVGRELRDRIFYKYPLMPQAVYTFQQIVSSREWAVGGKPDDVFATLDLLNNIQSKNLTTGLIEYGFESFEKRRTVDYNLIGRTAFGRGKRGGQDFIQYLDPIYLMFDRKGDVKSKRGYVHPIRPTEKAWSYDGRRYSAQDIMVHHPFPIGADNFISPVSPVLPTANLAWLIREHNAAALDGRKIRDILMVGSPSLRTSIEEALIRLASLYAGADVAEVGIPVVEINNMSGVPIKDLFAMIGISNMPEKLDPKEFMFSYANQLTVALGLALRHVWNVEHSGNRSLEEVQETRQQEKGPSAFVRSEQRLINQSGFLVGEARFGFVEESDLSSLKTKAEVLNAYSEAAERFQVVFGQSLTLPSFLSWMKRIGALPLDIELDETIEPEEISVDNSGDSLGEDETGLPGDPDVVGMEKSSREDMEKNLEPGEVVADQYGNVIGKRLTIFAFPSLKNVISEAAEKAAEARHKSMQEVLEKVKSYEETGEDEDDEIENLINHQHHLMSVEIAEELLKSDSLATEDRDKLLELTHKSAFNILFTEEDVKSVETIASKSEQLEAV